MCTDNGGDLISLFEKNQRLQIAMSVSWIAPLLPSSYALLKAFIVSYITICLFVIYIHYNSISGREQAIDRTTSTKGPLNNCSALASTGYTAGKISSFRRSNDDIGSSCFRPIHFDHTYRHRLEFSYSISLKILSDANCVLKYLPEGILISRIFLDSFETDTFCYNFLRRCFMTETFLRYFLVILKPVTIKSCWNGDVLSRVKSSVCNPSNIG